MHQADQRQHLIERILGRIKSAPNTRIGAVDASGKLQEKVKVINSNISHIIQPFLRLSELDLDIFELHVMKVRVAINVAKLQTLSLAVTTSGQQIFDAEKAAPG